MQWHHQAVRYSVDLRLIAARQLANSSPRSHSLCSLLTD